MVWYGMGRAGQAAIWRGQGQGQGQGQAAMTFSRIN